MSVRLEEFAKWWSDVQPPSSYTVDMERKPVLHLPDGRVLVKQIGYKATAVVDPRRKP
jgi:hypothetical protein